MYVANIKNELGPIRPYTFAMRRKKLAFVIVLYIESIKAQAGGRTNW